MKKIVVLIAALLSCSLAYSQEANNAGLSGELLIVPRLEFNPYVFTKDGHFEYDFGASGLYSLFEGDLSQHVSLSISNLWLTEYTKLLYVESFNPNYTTWVNWAYADIHYNNFFAILGKQALKVATFEEDEYDYNSYWGLSSHVWMNVPLYQWGGCVGWRSDDEDAEMGVQLTSGLSGRWPFQSGISAAAYITKEFNTTTRARISLDYFKQGSDPTTPKSTDFLRYFMVAGGVQKEFGDATVTVDGYFYNKYATFNTSIAGSFKYDFEKLDLTGKVGFDNYADSESANTSFFLGGVLQYYPLNHSEDLRIHLMTSYHTVPTYAEAKHFNFTLGVTYFFNIKLY